MELLDFYHPGGYRITSTEEKIRDQYVVIKKIGFGRDSTVFLTAQNIQIKKGISRTRRKSHQGVDEAVSVTTYR
ncbi:hypothetical protein QR680_002916 [Steinernema hermaphroditum]|uniref:Uncharacterized protein n=1 Tax=Steinernema hermaphroditum TaxID=289476 RepID=A0AA39LIN6_9BILA|nr:hypothetical protein QR680_002916 [Steinernema hermaphroditum]